MNKYIEAEQKLLYYMLRDSNVIKMFNKKVSFMPTSEYRNLFHEINCFYQEYNMINEADFMTYIASNIDLTNTLNEIERLNFKEKIDIEEIEDYMNVIKEYSVKKEIERLKEIQKSEKNMEKKQIIANQIIQLVKGE